MKKEFVYMKSDTSENWSKAKNFIPKKHEVIIYSDINKTKIGDGKTKLQDLLFINQDKYSVEGDMLVIESSDYKED